MWWEPTHRNAVDFELSSRNLNVKHNNEPVIGLYIMSINHSGKFASISYFVGSCLAYGPLECHILRLWWVGHFPFFSLVFALYFLVLFLHIPKFHTYELAWNSHYLATTIFLKQGDCSLWTYCCQMLPTDPHLGLTNLDCLLFVPYIFWCFVFL